MASQHGWSITAPLYPLAPESSAEAITAWASAYYAAYQADINGAPFNSNAPFGGYKQSGNGRENGKFGFEEFLEFKAMQFKPAAA
jgi:acyl-CoA reductase-like NAD-dependent aldehyde dehydrogenase